MDQFGDVIYINPYKIKIGSWLQCLCFICNSSPRREHREHLL